jgi:hypothetical protein
MEGCKVTSDFFYNLRTIQDLDFNTGSEFSKKAHLESDPKRLGRKLIWTINSHVYGVFKSFLGHALILGRIRIESILSCRTQLRPNMDRIRNTTQFYFVAKNLFPSHVIFPICDWTPPVIGVFCYWRLL